MAKEGIAVKILNPIEKAKLDPKSRAKALRAYFWDLEGIEDNKGKSDFPHAEARAGVRAAYKECQRDGLKGSIQRLCFECVGTDADPSPSPKVRVRDCADLECPLWPVRPWQRVQGRGAFSVGVPGQPRAVTDGR